MKNLTRRDIIKKGSAIAPFLILPSGLLAKSPNSKMNFALVGCGGNGRGTLKQMVTHSNFNLVGLCDVDRSQMVKVKKNVPMYQDHREMLDAMGDKIDGLMISTCDHNHHAVAKDAMLLGKHIYCQKPLTNKIADTRELMKIATQTGVVNQMGIQLHSSMANKLVRHILREGVIGKIKKVYVWSNKQWGINVLPKEIQIPKSMNWELYLGKVAMQPMRAGCHPAGWRRFLDFGVGTLGDMGVHIIDTPMAALSLKPAQSVKAICREPNGFGYPTSNRIEYTFAPTSYTSRDFKMVWHDGGLANRFKIDELDLPQGVKRPAQGAIYIGENGAILHPHGAGPIFMPAKLKYSVKKPKFSRENHYDEFMNACLDRSKGTSAHFDYAAPLTETVLLGVIGSQFPKQKLDWDSTRLKFTNIPEANQYV
ncbi:MAG: Gfo/Idh/MocA family oxidoreductase [Planctomycetes bacterium]|nr:Gfo/Idh/MocA family oxidoreductase [Planctomycetota bacterium]